MSSNPSRESIRKLTDDLSDTKSWAELAKELDKYVSKNRDESADATATIVMADLEESLEDPKDKLAK